ncbi:MAG: excinuclease ABC subunit UvrC [Candidatus Endonucleobacter sp. (ex Gigantidas childressi)]|nr:excinuclease ABC subunit UvrC [Candidatus Endonucleobacter sp. (ex Gigantidas childressi)]
MTSNDQVKRIDYRLFLKKTPECPGVYDMRDTDGKTLYIGKAKNLKKRISSYFHSSGLASKTIALINKVSDIDIIITNTEAEALILEQNLIKEKKPKYNILLKDDKSYPYIIISSDKKWPRLAFHRGKRNLGSCFGPYPNATSVRESLSILQKVFKVRQCDDSYFRNRSRPCLQYQIKRCKAPCVGLVSEEEYGKDVLDTAQFLSGKSETLLKSLAKRMDSSSSLFKYEQAAEIRDQIVYLRKIQEQQTVAKAGGNVDVIGYIEQSGFVCFNVLFIRHGLIIGSKNYFPDFKLESSKDDYFDWFLVQFYIHLSASRDFPEEIIISTEEKDIEVIQREIVRLAGKKVQVKVSVRGDRLKWLKLANNNAQQNLKARLYEKSSIDVRVGQLQRLLDLPRKLEIIECFDISHTSGESTVGSCVVFGRGGHLKNEYRTYNIKNVTPGDDYAATGQVLRRRYQKIKKEGKIPDLVLIDGGRGQLAVAETIMEELGLSDMPLLGVAKGVTRKLGMETLLYHGKELLTEGCEAALLLIQQIRDEAHRFAIAGHRTQRQKTRNRSILEDIPGVGSKRRTALLKYFGGRQGVLLASTESLSKVPSISQEMAQTIYEYLHN